MKSYKVVGWDNGYSFEKIVASPDEKDSLLFPSVTYRPPTGTSIFNVTAENQQISPDRMILQYQNREYFVGNYAIEQDPQAGLRSYNEDKFKEETETIKLLAALSSLTSNESHIHIELLALGLSLSTYKKYRLDVIEHFQNKTFTFKIPTTNRKTKLASISIDRVLCIPQGVGAFYDRLLNFQGIPVDDTLTDVRYGLIDIGGKTIDAFISQGIEPVRGSDIGLSHGTSDIFRDISKSLGDIPFNLIEQAFLNNMNELFWKGKYYNVSEVCKKAFKHLAENIYSKVQMEWTRQMNRVELILLCGGGAKPVAKHHPICSTQKLKLLTTLNSPMPEDIINLVSTLWKVADSYG